MSQSSVAMKCQRIVLHAAEPTFAGEKIKEQKRRSFDRLRLKLVKAGASIHHRAWNGLAGPSCLYVLEAQAEQAGLTIPAPARALIADLEKRIERLRHVCIDQAFMGPQVEAHIAELEKLMAQLRASHGG